MALTEQAVRILEKTSRTFFIPIMRLPDGLRDAVGSAYLCMRGIDEIEDHPELPGPIKMELLGSVSRFFQSVGRAGLSGELDTLLAAHAAALPDVTLRLAGHAAMAPASIAPRVWDATAAMADRMAYWVGANWKIRTERDLDGYTYGVAGAIGVLLSDLWAWYDGTVSERGLAVAFGRGLQAVNIIRNREEDLARGVDYYPDGWGFEEMRAYVQRQLELGDAYIAGLPEGPARDFCRIPLVLAHGTVEALSRGQTKLDRNTVLALIGQALSE